jgi:general secretion pathway protein I
MKTLEIEKRQPDFGFTLLEIMVAISIIAIVLIAIFKMHSQTINLNLATRFYSTAPLLAQNKIAELETTSLNDQMAESGNFGDDFPNYSWSVSMDNIESEILGAVSESLKKIEVTISYNNDELIYSFRTYKLLHE